MYAHFVVAICQHYQDEKEGWVPVTKLGRLVQGDKIKSLEEIYLYSLPVKGAYFSGRFNCCCSHSYT